MIACMEKNMIIWIMAIKKKSMNIKDIVTTKIIIMKL